MCAGGGDRLSAFIPVLLPPLPSLPLSFHHPLPNHSEISSDFFLLPTRLDCFSTLGFVKRFLVFQTGGGAFPHFFSIYFLNFLYFPLCFWAGASATTRLGFFPPSFWLLPSILWAVHTVLLLQCCYSPFLLSSFLLDPEQCSPE